MSVLRKGIHKYCAKALKRNQELRALLFYMEGSPNLTITELAEHFAWSRPKTRNGVEVLVDSDLAFVSERKPTAFAVGANNKAVVHHYSAKSYDADDLERELPVVAPEKAQVIRYAPKIVAKEVEKRAVGRDPLTAMLMGSGRAPSLNFIDSPQGVQHAEPQAAIQAYR